jgi:hypothetical protein
MKTNAILELTIWTMLIGSKFEISRCLDTIHGNTIAYMKTNAIIG